MKLVLGRLCWQYATVEVSEEDAENESLLLANVECGRVKVDWKPPTGYSEDIEKLMIVGPED